MANVIIVLWGQSTFDRAAQGLAGAGRRLADQLGGSLHPVGHGAAGAGQRTGAAAVAATVTVVDQPELAEYQPEVALAALEQLASGQDARAIVLGNDTYSQELAPRLARRLGGSSLADAVELKLDGGRVLGVRSAYGGKAMAVYHLKRAPAVVWVRARAIEPFTGAAANGTVDARRLELAAPRLRIVGRETAQSEGVKLEEAQLIVSGGRGLGGPEPFSLLKELADTIGAAQGASRAACDAGWVPPNWQVGQTGKKVAPQLYLAVAISGASQPLLGMGDSKVICAINTDAEAPIFKHCSFGIVEDYKNVVPRLTEKLRALKGA